MKAKNIDHAKALQIIHIEELQKALENIRKDVERSVSLRRDSTITVHNKATNITQPQVSSGEFFSCYSCYRSKSQTTILLVWTMLYYRSPQSTCLWCFASERRKDRQSLLRLTHQLQRFSTWCTCSPRYPRYRRLH